MTKNHKCKKYLIMLSIKEKIMKDKMRDIRDRVKMESNLAIYLISMHHNRFMIILEQQKVRYLIYNN